jgi:hypothetical protein
VTGTGCNTPVAHTVGAKVLLGGALTSGYMMRTNLRTQNLLPTTEPYSAMGLAPENAGETIAQSVMQATGSQAIVDWVLLELRNADAGNTLAARKAVLVRANGDVITPDGSMQIPFSTATQGRHLMIRHRNHLSIMTAAPMSSNAQVVDLTTSNTNTFGTSARMNINGVRAMWPGDVNGDEVVSYTNANNDRDLILVAIGSVVPSNTTTGYLPEDVNLDGVVKYTGTDNDRDIILTTVGGIIPTAIKEAQLP